MTASHLEILVEEESMEAFLEVFLARLLPGCTFRTHVFNGKRNLLRNLNSRLRGYRHWLPPNCRVVVLVDCDNDDCEELKRELESAAAMTGLRTRSRAGENPWQVVNRVVIEELEAWYFGDWEAVHRAYPRVSPRIPNQPRYNNPDAIRGGTWETFERILKRHGYFKTGLRKIEAARAIAPHIDPERNRSPSFGTFHTVLGEAIS